MAIWSWVNQAYVLALEAGDMNTALQASVPLFPGPY